MPRWPPTGAVLAVKPADAEAACRALAGAGAGAGRVLSIAAGVPTVRLEEWLGDGMPVVRAMPNTPALVGAGAAAIAAGTSAGDDDLDWAEGILARGRRRRAGAREAARRGHRPVRLGPGLRLPGGRGADRGRGARRAAPASGQRPRRPDPARRGPAAGRVGRQRPRRCGRRSRRPAARPRPGCGCSRATACAAPSWRRSRRPPSGPGSSAGPDVRTVWRPPAVPTFLIAPQANTLPPGEEG